MMLGSLILASAVAAQAPAQAEEGPVTQFISACIDGQLKLTPPPERVNFDKLPHGLRIYLDGWEKGTFYKISRPQEAYLLFGASDPDVDGSYVENCAVASKDIELRSAFARAFLALPGAEIDRDVSAKGILTAFNKSEGYLFMAYALAPTIMMARPMDVHFRMLQMKIDRPAVVQQWHEPTGTPQPSRK